MLRSPRSRSRYWGIDYRLNHPSDASTGEQPDARLPAEWARHQWPYGLSWLTDTDERGRFLNGFARNPQHSILIGAKDTGKSLTFALLSLWWMTHQPLPRLRNVGLIAGSEEQAKITYRHLRNLSLSARDSEKWLAKPPKEIEIHLRNGARCWVYASSYYSAHGEHPGLVIADEGVLASRSQEGEVLKGALASVATGGYKILGSAPYHYDSVFMPTWDHAEERGYRRHGPWRKHPWEELAFPYLTPVNRRPWLTLPEQIQAATEALKDPNENYRVFWVGELSYGVGNLFPAGRVDEILGDYPLEPVSGARKALGVDTGFGSSRFALLGVEERDSMLHVLVAEEYERPDFNEMAGAVAQLYHDDHYDAVLVDASNPEFIRTLEKWRCDVVPVVFARRLPSLIGYLLACVDPQRLRIHRVFQSLLHQLRNAQWNASGRGLEKGGSLTLDSVDALMCALQYWAAPEPTPASV